MSRMLSVLLLGMTLSVLTGCGKETSSPTSDSPETDASVTAADGQSAGIDGSAGAADSVASAISDSLSPLTGTESAAPTQPAWPERAALTGNWLLRVFHMVPPPEEELPPQLGERPVVLFQLEPGDGDAEDRVEIVAGRDEFEVAVTATGSIDGERLEIEGLRAGGQRAFLFEGRRAADGSVMGSIVFANGSAQAARLVPTDERTFVRIPVFDPLPETIELMKLGNSPVPDEDTRLLVEKFPTSPIAAIAWKQLIQRSAAEGKPNDEVTQLVDEYCSSQSQWTERLGRLARIESFLLLSAGGADPSWCLSAVDSVIQALEEDSELTGFRKQVDLATLQCRFRQTLDLFDSESEEDRQRGETQAKKLLEELPHEPMLTIALADRARERGNTDRAIELYAELVALPLQEKILQQRFSQSPVKKILPTERLSRLWKDKHGSTEGLDEFIRKTYDEKLLDFVSDTFDSRPEDSGTRTALLELFTGTRCAPCVTADVALAGLDQTYPRSMLVTLRYHLHLPEHDPLTNEDNEARFFNYYRAQTTPALFLDGIPVEGIRGSVSDAPARYNDIRNMLVSRYSQETDVSIQLSASRQSDTITVSASVEGADLTNERLRLRLVLAENEVPFLGFNGIRRHAMVARQMIGGDRGIAPSDGKLAWTGTISVSEVRDSLHQYLTDYEQNTGVEFSSMPLDLEELSIIAIVQDDATRHVLQSRLVPVQAGVVPEDQAAPR